MKIANIWAILLSTVAISMQLWAMQPGQEAQKQSLEHINQKIELLEQLSVAVNKVFVASKRYSRLSAKKEVSKLFHELDKKAQDTLSDDIKIILDSANNNHINVTRKRIYEKIDSLKAEKTEAVAIQSAQEKTITTNAASDELNPKVVEGQDKKIIAAEREAKKQHYLSCFKARVFGEEVSWSKAGFYSTAVVAALVGLYYCYQHAEDIERWLSGEEEDDDEESEDVDE